MLVKLTTLFFCAAAAILPVAAQESFNDNDAQYKEGVYTGETSVYRDNPTLPADEGVYETEKIDQEIKELPANDVAGRKALQKERAEQLKENDSWGGSLSIISMGIVILALAVLSILFLIFGKVSSTLQKKRKRNTSKVGAMIKDEGALTLDSGEAIAAIAAALAEHFSGKHDMEDTILTIKRMKRAYSPWNSKIYNLRVTPDVHHRHID